MFDPKIILLDVLSKYSDVSKWVDATFGHIKRISNTHVGGVGQDFVEKLCEEIGFHFEFPLNKDGKRSKRSSWDIKIKGVTFEVKTASEDTSGNFQFNHIRHHRDYEVLLCIGIAPENIVFGAWSKADVSTRKAGSLVTMDKGSSATFKLTKRKSALLPISEFENKIIEIVKEIKSA